MTELPDDIRVPLHSLQADMDYLFGRVAGDGSCAPAMAESVKARLTQIEEALTRRSSAGVVKVKPLEWREVESTTGSHEIYEATSILGYYRVVGCPDGSWFVGGASAERPPNDATDPKQWCMDWAEKYNRTRILSALSPQEPVTGEAVGSLEVEWVVNEIAELGVKIWIDTHATFANRVYRDRVIASPSTGVNDAMVETMWGEVVFEGEDNSFLWKLDEAGNQDGVHYERSIELSADTFPEGTKLVIREPALAAHGERGI